MTVELYTTAIIKSPAANGNVNAVSFFFLLRSPIFVNLLVSPAFIVAERNTEEKRDIVYFHAESRRFVR